MLLFRKFICSACGHEWELPLTIGGKQNLCPECGQQKVHRIDSGIRERKELNVLKETAR